MVNYRKSKHPLTLVRGYSLLLNGSPDFEILSAGIKLADLAKIQRFHDCISQNKHYLTVAYEICIDLKHAKKMAEMHEQHARGETVSYCPKKSYINCAVQLILDGFTDSELLDKGLSDADINSAKLFLEMAPYAHTMLPATLGKKLGISRSATIKLLKIHKEKQTERMQPEMCDTRIPVLA
jgi:hypothetical protein